MVKENNELIVEAYSGIGAISLYLKDKAKEIKNLQDKVLPQLQQQLADTKGFFKGKERKALEVKIKETH